MNYSVELDPIKTFSATSLSVRNCAFSIGDKHDRSIGEAQKHNIDEKLDLWRLGEIYLARIPADLYRATQSYGRFARPRPRRDLCWIIMAAPIFAVIGCVAVWGKPYKVEFASSSSITINFDPSLTNMGEVQNVAQAHCDQFGKDAIPQASQGSMWALRTMSFLCKKRE
jgi:hypothetical protein